MSYQLVLQWPASSLDDFDRLIEIENQLIEQLPRHHGEVDGHDMGSGESNIFVLTDDPGATIEAARSVIGACGALDGFRAGYRRIDGEDFSVLWPAGLGRFEVA